MIAAFFLYALVTLHTAMSWHLLGTSFGESFIRGICWPCLMVTDLFVELMDALTGDDS